ncbi:MAG: hypothetical protein ABJE79_08535 [Marinomonas sp.]
MMIRKSRQALVLAVVLLTGLVTNAHGHSLPGSVLVFSEEMQQQESQLTLKVTFPLEDMIIASNKLEMIQGAPINQALSEQATQLLADYFSQHMKVQKDQQDLPFTLQKAELNKAYHHDLGEYILVVSYFTAPKPEGGKLFPLILSYDAVMHEIRSHRATVYWQETNGDQQKLVRFRFKREEGKPKAYLLNR